MTVVLLFHTAALGTIDVKGNTLCLKLVPLFTLGTELTVDNEMQYINNAETFSRNESQSVVKHFSVFTKFLYHATSD